MAPNRDDGRGAHWKNSFGVRARCRCRTDNDGSHLSSRQFRPPGQHDARSDLRFSGTMFANQSGLQKSTLRNILIAWVLTSPACFFLGATIFAGMLYLFFNVLGWK